MTIDRPRQTVEIEVESRPRAVIFNPDHAVLARTGKL